jgi:hypothetical protein
VLFEKSRLRAWKDNMSVKAQPMFNAIDERSGDKEDGLEEGRRMSSTGDENTERAQLIGSIADDNGLGEESDKDEDEDNEADEEEYEENSDWSNESGSEAESFDEGDIGENKILSDDADRRAMLRIEEGNLHAISQEDMGVSSQLCKKCRTTNHSRSAISYLDCCRAGLWPLQNTYRLSGLGETIWRIYIRRFLDYSASRGTRLG